MANTRILPKFTFCLLFGLSFVPLQGAYAQRGDRDWGERYRRDRGDDERDERDRDDDDQDRRRFRWFGGDRGESRGGFGDSARFGGFRGGFGGDRERSEGFRGGFGPPSPDRLFEMMDRDRDGRVETDEMWGPMRDRLERSGVDIERGLSRSDMTRAFERLRSDSGDRDDSPNNRGEDGRRSNESSGPYVGNSHERVTVDLPLAYIEGDIDSDGQIGFYEWRRWRRNQTENFFAIDANGDGFLTPKELVTAPTAIATAGSAGSSTALAAPPGARPAESPSESRPSTPSTSGAGNGSEVARNQGESMFRALDRNRDGSVTEDEWARSRRLRPMFENGGVDLSRPMSRETFVETYVKLNQNS